MNILLTGGAGYIGSCTANLLIDKGHQVTIIDNLSTGSRQLIPKKAKFFECNIQSKKVNEILIHNNFDLVMHFAAFIQVEESIKLPKKYLQNNFINSVKFLNVCKKNNLKNIIISSTAAVYGVSAKVGKKFSERASLRPTNPYAHSKLKLEKYVRKYKYFNYIIFRYFNVAGADLFLRSGQISKKSTHLIKKICESLIEEKSIDVYGSDYPTKDGTAIRDYIHVVDLANAHLLAANYLLKTKKSQILNCGYGYGYSVKEVIDTFNKINFKKIKYIYKSRRKGDVSSLVSNSNKIKKILGWKTNNKSLLKILKTHLLWEKKLNEIK
jgi:UDP-glucose 4-epimerase